jgi:uncharacterized Tic20 family protein
LNPETRNAAPDPTPRERREAALAHASALLLFFFPFGNLAGPALVLWAAGRRSAFVRSHGLQSLVYQTAVSLAVWTLFLLVVLRGGKPEVHMAALLLSLVPVAWASFTALRGKSVAYPLVSRLTWAGE